MTQTLTFERLVDFLERRMSMCQVYQPVLIRTLMDAGGCRSCTRGDESAVATMSRGRHGVSADGR